MLSGNSVYSSLTSKVNEIEKEISSTGGELDSSRAVVKDLLLRRNEVCFNLAKIYLPELTDSTIRHDALDEIEGRLTEIFDQKRERNSKLTSLIKESTNQISKSHDKMELVNSRIEEKNNLKEKVEKNIGEELNSDENYKVLKSKADELKIKVDKNRARIEIIQKDADEKLKMYDDSLFKYLVNREFGSDYYEPGNRLIKFLDRFVANIVNFAENKKNYDYLVTKPNLAREKVNERIANLEKLADQLEQMENKVATKYKLPELIEEENKLIAEKNHINSALELLNTSKVSYVNEQKAMNTKDGYYEKVVNEAANFIAKETIEELRDRARKTPSPEDDGYVVQLEDINSRISSENEKINRLNGLYRNASDRLSRLKEIDLDFKTNKYDSSRSQFPDTFRINELLIGYMLGQHDKGHVLTTVQRNHSLKPVPVSSYSHDSGSSGYTYRSPSRSSYGSSLGSLGGGFGGGGRSFGGGFGGGGRSFGGKF